MRRIRSIKGKRISVSGRCWITRQELRQKILVSGGDMRVAGSVSVDTDIFIRGRNVRGQGKFKGIYSQKEYLVADYIKEGVEILVVDQYEFRKLLEGKYAQCSNSVVGSRIYYRKTRLKKVQQPAPTDTTYARIAKIRGSLDRQHTANGRTEQAYLRRLLFQGRELSPCSLCGQKLPI